MASLARTANFELLCNSNLPPPSILEITRPALEWLEDWMRDPRLALKAAAAEWHQRAAGLASCLSAAELQLLVFLLHNRCARHAARAHGGAQDAHARQLLQTALADLDRAVALEGGSPTPALLRWRGFSRTELGMVAPAAADLEAALAACEAHPGAKACGACGMLHAVLFQAS